MPQSLTSYFIFQKTSESSKVTDATAHAPLKPQEQLHTVNNLTIKPQGVCMGDASHLYITPKVLNRTNFTSTFYTQHCDVQYMLECKRLECLNQFGKDRHN